MAQSYDHMQGVEQDVSRHQSYQHNMKVPLRTDQPSVSTDSPDFDNQLDAYFNHKEASTPNYSGKVRGE